MPCRAGGIPCATSGVPCSRRSSLSRSIYGEGRSRTGCPPVRPPEDCRKRSCSAGFIKRWWLPADRALARSPAGPLIIAQTAQRAGSARGETTVSDGRRSFRGSFSMIRKLARRARAVDRPCDSTARRASSRGADRLPKGSPFSRQQLGEAILVRAKGRRFVQGGGGPRQPLVTHFAGRASLANANGGAERSGALASRRIESEPVHHIAHVLHPAR